MIEKSHINLLFETLTNKNPLLPDNLEHIRLKTKVFDSLNIKGRPNSKQFNQFAYGRYNYDSFLETLKPFLLKQLDSMNLCLMDKLSPHAQYELMLISTGPKVISTIAEHGSAEREKTFQLFSCFPQFAKNNGLFPYMAFSYDPDTTDRESGQSEKRFHAHFIGRTDKELNTIEQGVKQLDQISYLRRRRLLDEFSIVASMIFTDFITSQSSLKSISLEPCSPDSTPSLKFSLTEGWDTLATIQFDEDFQTIHRGLTALFNNLTADFINGQFGYWQRPNLKIGNIKEKLTKYHWLSPTSSEVLEYFLYRLNPHLLKKGTYFSNPSYRDITTHVYPLNGLCYSTAFFEENKVAKMLIRPQLFSDLGGAGVENINGVTIKIKRNVGIFSDAEMEDRRRFQNSFIKEIN